jgi:hypothetical protein
LPFFLDFHFSFKWGFRYFFEVNWIFNELVEIWEGRFTQLEQEKILQDAHWQEQYTIMQNSHEKALQVITLFVICASDWYFKKYYIKTICYIGGSNVKSTTP